MSNVYCVSYDLKGEDADYTSLYAALKASAHWWHYLQSTWLIVVKDNADGLWARLEPHLKQGDRLLVIGVSADSQGLLPQKAWEWIRRNVDSMQTER